MDTSFDFVVVGGGSAGAVVAARLSEDPACRVALLEAGERPPARELIPAAVASLQRDPAVDWMLTADPGENVGMGLHDGRTPVPRGKMLGGSSGINFMAYVRGHPGDFDAWEAGGAVGWSYGDVLPYFRKSETFVSGDAIDVDPEAHGSDGPMGVSVRQPVVPVARDFVSAAEAAGIPRGDYNGEDRRKPEGVASLLQTNTRDGKRTSTYRAFLEGEVERRPNLTIITGALVTRIRLDDTPEGPVARGVEYRRDGGESREIEAREEVIVCAGAVGSPQLLMLSGIGPRQALEALGIRCRLDAPDVGQHLQDHVQVALFFEAPGHGVSVQEIAISMGPDALRGPGGPLPADPEDDAGLSAALQDLKRESERRLKEWEETGRSLVSSSLYDAAVWYSTGLGDHHTHDAQISFCASGYDLDTWSKFPQNPTLLFDDPAATLAPERENVVLLANPVQPHSRGEIRLRSADPTVAPDIRMNAYGDPHDMKVMVAVLRRALDIVAHWPVPDALGPWQAPPFLAKKHGHQPGERPSDPLLEDLARYFPATVYHLSCTCRIGSVVDERLRVKGVANLRVADASIMPRLVSGNPNAAVIMIGEKAAEMVARERGVRLDELVGEPVRGRPADAVGR